MKFTKHILDNGMIIMLLPMKQTELIAVGFFIDVGSKDEGDNYGLAHFFEHMMFAGTEKRSQEQLFKSLDGMAAEYNAITTSEHTYYYVNGHCDDTKKIIDIVLDIYIHPVFKPNRIRKESKVIIEEMRMGKDNPYTKISNKMHEIYFQGTGLGKPIIGTEESVSQLKQSDFHKFRKKYYIPKNTVFVIAGNFNAKQIYPIIEKVLSKLDNPKKSEKVVHKNDVIKHMQSQNEPYVYILRDPSIYQAYVLLTFPIYDLYKTNEQEINIISHVLSTGFSSRLFTALRIEHGQTYSLSAYPLNYESAGVFIIKTIIHPNELVEGIKNILTELRKIKKTPLDKTEYKKITTIIKRENIFNSAQPIDWLSYYGVQLLRNREFNSNTEEMISKTSAKKVMEIAQKIFLYDKLNLFIYGNVKEENYDFIDL